MSKIEWVNDQFPNGAITTFARFEGGYERYGYYTHKPDGTFKPQHCRTKAYATEKEARRVVLAKRISEMTVLTNALNKEIAKQF